MRLFGFQTNSVKKTLRFKPKKKIQKSLKDNFATSGDEFSIRPIHIGCGLVRVEVVRVNWRDAREGLSRSCNSRSLFGQCIIFYIVKLIPKLKEKVNGGRNWK
ncbi:hypothetical protein PanWU01x14_076670 [Parasponia andersonii]|uniref:Uncharacterized protein n=1 Tax=Parasponia andersonii TaxID=3476 RepID=A0A2P5DCE4_PARAD|nr:hypothetical protein PanWU01x14_076670 [Parasponia andersonii]